MISIGKVWDRTTDVMAGRLSILLAIAGALVFAPAVVDAAIKAVVTPGSALAMAAGLFSFVVIVLTIWASLSLTAVASDPGVDRDGGFRIGADRLLPGIGIVAVMVVAAILVAVPGLVLLVLSGVDMERAQQGLDQVDLDGSRLGLAFLWFFAMAVVGLWISARFVPLFAVITNERRGIGAFGRALALTRGSTWKLVGVIILYAIVTLVVLAAASSIVGLIARLLLGADSITAVTFLVAIVAAVVTTGLSIVQTTFSAQFYLAARDRVDGRVDGAAPLQ